MDNLNGRKVAFSYIRTGVDVFVTSTSAPELVDRRPRVACHRQSMVCCVTQPVV